MSHIYYLTQWKKNVLALGFGIYPDKSDASGITLVKDVLMGDELIMEPHAGGVLWGSQQMDQPGSLYSVQRQNRSSWIIVHKYTKGFIF